MASRPVSILLVEDDRVDVMIIRRLFEKKGIANPLLVAASGEEALDILNRAGRRAGDGDVPLPGLILLDLRMPGMSGLELLRVLKIDPDLRAIPALVLTSSDEDSDVNTALNRGAAGFMMKPPTLEGFCRALEDARLPWKLSLVPNGDER